ncbi:MAG: type II secretion system protein [Tissierellia bacterium]|nr:type II secretion system protein [Tissierellia bacterium]
MKKGFTLIEAIVAIGLISIIAVMMLPALSNSMNNSNDANEDIKNLYLMQKELEEAKGYSIGNYNKDKMKITVSNYSDKLKKIEVSSDDKTLYVIVEK